jgi:predicted nucleic acid-binding protein
MNFADTNWLVAVYASAPREREHGIAERFMERHDERLLTSHHVLLEIRNVLRRLSGESKPPELEQLLGDFDSKLFVDPMNWPLLRRDAEELFERYAWKVAIGTLDTIIVASAKQAAATRFLSFDQVAAALAAAEGMEVFPALDTEGKRLLKQLKS